MLSRLCMSYNLRTKSKLFAGVSAAFCMWCMCPQNYDQWSILAKKDENCFKLFFSLFERNWIGITIVSCVTVKSCAIYFKLRVVTCRQLKVTSNKCVPLQSNACHCSRRSNGMQRYCVDLLVSFFVRPSMCNQISLYVQSLYKPVL